MNFAQRDEVHMHKQMFCILGYQAAYCQLAFAGSTDHDPFSASIPDAKIYLVQSLNQLSTTHPGKVRHFEKFYVNK